MWRRHGLDEVGVRPHLANILNAPFVPEDKALKAATALSKRDDDVASIKSDVLLMKWMLGVVLAFQIAIAVRLFVH
jgi:hypothetical protein